MYRTPKFYADDPEPEEDEPATPRHLWAMSGESVCDACPRTAVATCYIQRGDDVDPAKFKTCHDHALNVAMAGGKVDLWEIR